MKIFQDRREAGDLLAAELEKLHLQDVLVLGIPRGGVVVAARVAEKLGCPLDIIIPRKIGAPYNPEVAVGAVTQDGTVLLNHMLISIYQITQKQIDNLVEEQIAEIKRRMVEYRGNDQYPRYKEQTVLLVDDGIATGFTVKAAIASVKNIFKPRKIILAVPVAPPDTVREMSEAVDQVVCLLMPDDFYAVGQFYRSFEQTEDQEVIELLERNRRLLNHKP